MLIMRFLHAVAVVLGTLSSTIIMTGQVWADDPKPGKVLLTADNTARDLINKELNACGAKKTCFLTMMESASKESKAAYKVAVRNLHPVARDVLSKCTKLNKDILHRVDCYNIYLKEMVAGATEVNSRLQEATASQWLDLLDKKKHLLALVARESCDGKVTDECFDRVITAVAGQFAVARQKMALTQFHMARWSIAAYRCGEKVAEGACLQGRQWSSADFIVHENEAPYLGIPVAMQTIALPEDKIKPAPKPKSTPKPAPKKKIDPSKAKDKDLIAKNNKPEVGDEEPANGEEEGTDLFGGTAGGDGKKKGSPTGSERRKKSNGEEQDKKGGKAAKFWEPETLNGGGNGDLDCSPEMQLDAVAQLKLPLDQQKESIKVLESYLYACAVNDTVANNKKVNDGIKQALLVLSKAASSIALLDTKSEVPIDVIIEHLEWAIDYGEKLESVADVPGPAELSAAVAYFKGLHDMQPIALGRAMEGFGKPGTALPKAVCPWIKAVQKAAGDVTAVFPPSVLDCSLE